MIVLQRKNLSETSPQFSATVGGQALPSAGATAERTGADCQWDRKAAVADAMQGANLTITTVGRQAHRWARCCKSLREELLSCR